MIIFLIIMIIIIIIILIINKRILSNKSSFEFSWLDFIDYNGFTILILWIFH